jgi:hypothetical protein
MSLRNRLQGRKPPTQVVPLPIDPVAYAECARELSEATWELEQARARGVVDTAALRARVLRAQDAQNALDVERVTLRALPAADWEALVDAHPPTEQQADGGAAWNPTTFRPALLALSIVPENGDEPVSADDWEQLAKSGEISAGELTALFTAAVELNLRAPSMAVGKGV